MERAPGARTITNMSTLKRDLGLKLSVIVRQMRKDFHKRAGEVGVTRSQWSLIAVVANIPGTTQRTIAEALEMSEASVGRLIDRLCVEGLLERRPKDDDRRAYCIYLTEKAAPLLSQLARIGHEHDDRSFAGISDEELLQLTELIDKVYHNVVESQRWRH